MVKHLERVVTIYFFPDILILGCQNHEHMHEIFLRCLIAI